MPYIKKEEVKIKRKAIQKAFPQYKFSITNENYSGIQISVMEGPIPLTEKKDGYEQVNHFFIEDYKRAGEMEKYNLFSKIYEIANSDNGILVVDGDYGVVPDFYVWIRIGKWDKPYVINTKN